jgi:hypothetical protein
MFYCSYKKEQFTEYQAIIIMLIERCANDAFEGAFAKKANC